jgi:protein O-GlcNAc transferase
MPHGATPASVGALIAGGRAGEALAAAQLALETDPANPQWLHLLAVAQHAHGVANEAAATLERALKLAPADATLWNTYGAVQLEREKLDDADRALREALRIDSGYLQARFNLALVLRRRGEIGAAAEELARIQSADPAFAPARLERATLHIEAGEAASALPLLEMLDQAHPGNPLVLSNLAAALQRLGRFDEAADVCARALARPDIDARGIVAIAQTLAASGREDDARIAAERAASLAPRSREVRTIAGDVLAAAGHHAKAREHYAFAVGVRRDAALLAKFGNASLASGNAALAAECFEEQSRIEPDSRAAVVQLAIALEALRRRGDARQVLARAITRGIRDAEILSDLAVLKAKDCDWQGLDALVAELRETALVRGGHPAFPQHAMYFDGIGAREQKAWAENWSRARWPGAKPATPRRAAVRPRRRIGYLSSDFHDHAVSHLAIGLLENHDRARHEIVAYSFGPDDRSPLRGRLVGAFDAFVEMRELSDRAAAERIRADGLDALVDLGGYAKDSRFGVLAHRPAPVQLHFLGYPGTTGAPFIDYYVADRYTVPQGFERHFTETVLRMPHCYQPNDAKRAILASIPRAECGLPEDALVLCSFNQEVKLTRPVFDRWCDLLLALPGAVLWQVAPDGDAQRNLEVHMRERGVDPARLLIAPRVHVSTHLARLGNADIALDTFPYGSHTTASDALWAGVPLIALSGDSFASRVAGSILSAAECGDWAFEDHDAAFVATLALARDRNALGEARRRIERARREAPLFDSPRFARDYESLLESFLARP